MAMSPSTLRALRSNAELGKQAQDCGGCGTWPMWRFRDSATRISGQSARFYSVCDVAASDAANDAAQLRPALLLTRLQLNLGIMRYRCSCPSEISTSMDAERSRRTSASRTAALQRVVHDTGQTLT